MREQYRVYILESRYGIIMGKMTLQQMITQLAGGMAVSTQIFVITLLFSLPLGLVIAFGRMSKNKLIQTIVKVYI